MSDLIRRLSEALADRYVIEGRLGSGATALVVLARDVKHERQVALKVLRPEFAQSLGTERFLREIRLVAGFTHPHILPLYDSGEAGGLLYYAMPLARGGSLRSLLAQERPLPVPDAVRIAHQVASALAYAHTRGVVHRDIKPENILLEDGEVLLTDFGLARGSEGPTNTNLTDPGLAVGTPIYMSPEQASGIQVDGRSDVYSLGCVLYEMLDGEPPFTGRSAEVVLARHRNEAPRSLDVSRPGLPPALRQAVERSLAKLPADRFPSANAFAEAVRTAGDPMFQTPVSVNALPIRRRRWGAVAAGALAAVIPVAVAMKVLFPRNPIGAPLTNDINNPRRMAVMFFTDATPGQTPRVMPDGITQELIDRLGNVPALFVVSAEGVRQFRTTGVAPDSLARLLRVGTVVTGSVAASTDSVEATIRMIDGPSGRQVQSFTVSRPRGEMVGLVRAMTEELSVKLRKRVGASVDLARSHAGASSELAWEHYYEADMLYHDGIDLTSDGRVAAGKSAFLRADSLLDQASRLDARWSDPYIQRGWIKVSDAVGAFRRRPVDRDYVVNATREALDFAARGLAVATDSADGLELRGAARFVQWQVVGDSTLLPPSESDFLRATALRPSFASAWWWLSRLYKFTGQTAESSVAARHAYEADAYLKDGTQIVSRLLFASMELEAYDDAERWCREGRRRYASYPQFQECELSILARRGRGTQAVAQAYSEFRRVDVVDSTGVMQATRPSRYLYIAAVLARSGLVDSARATIARGFQGVSPADRDHFSAYEAYVRLEMGERDSALALLRRHIAATPSDGASIAASALFRGLRDDEQFRGITRGAR